MNRYVECVLVLFFYQALWQGANRTVYSDFLDVIESQSLNAQYNVLLYLLLKKVRHQHNSYSIHLSNINDGKQSRPSSSDATFRTFNRPLAWINVTFQEVNRPTGNTQEDKIYYSGKHKLYGYEVEVAARPIGLSSRFSPQYSVYVPDIHIMSNRSAKHEQRLRKK